MMRHLIVGQGWHLRAEGKREIEAVIVPYDTVGDTGFGLEMMARGAFGEVDPSTVVLRMDHTDPPAGRGISYIEAAEGDVGPTMVFSVASTPRGDELLATVQAGLEPFVSIGFEDVPGGWETRSVDGRQVMIHNEARLREVSTTWRPVFEDATILATRSRDGGPPMPQDETQTSPPAPDTPADDRIDRALARLDDLETRARQVAVTLPDGLRTQIEARAGDASDAMVRAGRWASATLRMMAGDRIPASELETWALADVITADNLGVVPKNVRGDVIIGEIDKSRPFLESTRQIPAGSAGMTQTVPKITQRPEVDVQATEKAEVASQATAITTQDFGVVTLAGAGDLSLQLIKRSSPEFLGLWLSLLAEQYAIVSDDKAVDALLAATPSTGGEFDPADPTFGAAFENAIAAGRTLLPDRIWLSTAALVSFIDAKEPAGGGGRALYPGLSTIAGISPGAGEGGPLPVRLRPVWVPALDDEAVDVIIGPSRGFLWAEDGTYTLQADVPSKAGRDVGLAGMIWYMPIYPAAFTTYTLPVVVP